MYNMKSLLVITVVVMVMTLVRTDNNDGIMTEVLREQTKLIKYCMTTRCHGYNYKPPIKQPSNPMIVAFQAHPSSHLQNKPKHIKIVFDMADTKMGDAYNAKDGVFTAPVNAVYAFHLTTMINPGHRFVTHLKVNGNVKARNFGSADGYKSWYSTSQMYVVHLKQGDKVWLSTDEVPGQFMHKCCSTFSGYKL